MVHLVILQTFTQLLLCTSAMLGRHLVTQNRQCLFSWLSRPSFQWGRQISLT